MKGRVAQQREFSSQVLKGELCGSMRLQGLRTGVQFYTTSTGNTNRVSSERQVGEAQYADIN